MFYNYKYALHFILLCVAFVATLNGLMILKTRSLEPSGALQTTISGRPAVMRGAALLALGIACFAGFLWLLFG